MNVSLGLIWELSIVGVADPGVPNQERVIIRPSQEVELGLFGIGLGWLDDPTKGTILPIQNHFFWFPNYVAIPPLWIFVYTGKGQSVVTTNSMTKEPAIVYHWGHEITLFNFAQQVPVLYRVPDMLVGTNLSRPRYERAPPMLKQPEPKRLL